MNLQKKCAVLGVSVLSAIAAQAAFATPGTAAGQLPGNGEIVSAASGLTVSMSTANGQIYVNTQQSVGVPGISNGAVVISGSTTVTNPAVVLSWNSTSQQGSTFNQNPADPGFNVGSQAAMTFVNNATDPGQGVAVNVLNIDTTGTASQIEGALAYQGNGGSLWLANANGVIIGTQASITVPGGMGILATPDASNTSSGFEQAFVAGGSVLAATLPIDFSGSAASGTGISISTGAMISTGYLLVAGSNEININAAPESAAPLIVDGGVSVPVGGFSSAGLANGGQVLLSGTAAQATTLSINLGTSNAAYSSAYIANDGDVNNLGNLRLTQPQMDWVNGTFTNSAGATLNIANSNSTSDYAILGFDTLGAGASATLPAQLSSIGQVITDASGAVLPNGAFVNASGATLNTVATSGSAIFASNITLDGTQNFANGPVYLIDTSTNASSSSMTISTPLTVSGGNLVISTHTLNVDNAINVSGGDFSYYASTGSITNPAMLNLSTAASITANNVYLGTMGGVPTSFEINGNITAADSVVFGSYNNTPTLNVTGAGSITSPVVDFDNLIGYVNNITSSQILQNGFSLLAPGGSTGNISVSVTADGNLTTGSAEFNPNLTSTYASGSATYTQGNNNVNLNVLGNLAIDSGETLATAPSYTDGLASSLAPANANSLLLVQASGNIQVNGGAQGGSNYLHVADTNIADAVGVFQYPGLIYLQSGTSAAPGNVTVGSFRDPVMISNAFGIGLQNTAVPAGPGYSVAGNVAPGRAGVFLLGSQISYYAPALYTSGGAGVVFAQPANSNSYYAPTSIIGNSASLPTSLSSVITDGLPLVDFLQPVQRGQGLVTPYTTAPYPYAALVQPMLYQGSYTFTNAEGAIQQYFTFLTLGTPNAAVSGNVSPQ